MKEKLTLPRISLYLIGLFFLSLGTAASVCSGLGCGPVISIPYTVSLLTSLNLGATTILWQFLLLFLQFLILRHDFKPWMLFQLITGFLFGYFNNIGLWIIGRFPSPLHFPAKLLYICVAFILGGFGIWLYTSSDVINMPNEGIIRAISDKSGRPFHLVKIGFDVFCVFVSAVTCLGVFHTLGSIGIGTAIIAVMFGTMIGICSNLWGKQLSTFLGNSSPEQT